MRPQSLARIKTDPEPIFTARQRIVEPAEASDDRASPTARRPGQDAHRIDIDVVDLADRHRRPVWIGRAAADGWNTFDEDRCKLPPLRRCPHALAEIKIRFPGFDVARCIAFG